MTQPEFVSSASSQTISSFVKRNVRSKLKTREMGGDCLIAVKTLDVQGLGAFLAEQNIAPILVQVISDCHCDGSAFCEANFINDVFTAQRMDRYNIVPVALARLQQLHVTIKEADRKAKEEGDRKAKEEADRKAKEEADRKAKDEADRKAKEEADRKAKEEADRRAKEEASEVVIDISWTAKMLEEKALPKGKSIRLTNSTGLTNVDHPSACCGDSIVALEPISVVMDPSMRALKSVGFAFLRGCRSVLFVDLRELSNVVTIGNDFFCGCSSLTTINLNHLSNVTSVGSSFLSGCSSLVSVDLAPLSKLTIVEGDFLAQCTSLQAVDLSPLKNATSFGNYVLGGCSALRAVNLKHLFKVTDVGLAFLAGCSSLASVDLSQMTNVIAVGNAFLEGCKSLRDVDLSPWSNATIPDGKSDFHFIFDCAPGLQIVMSNKMKRQIDPARLEMMIHNYGWKIIVR